MAGRDLSSELFSSEGDKSKGRDLSADLFGKAPSKERTWGESATDIGAGLIGGVGSLVQLPGQLYGLATGNFNKTGALGAGEQISQYAEEMKSAGLKAREAERAQKIAESAQKGQFAAAGTAFAETVKDPALLLTFLAQQAPQLLVPFGAARGVGMAAKGLGAAEAAASKAAVSGAVSAGAVQQGADIGAGAYENIYKELISKGASPKEAAEGSLNLARQAGAAAGTLSLLVQRLPGARQLEEALAGVPGKGAAGLAGRLKTAGGTALGETVSEIPEEVGGKFAQNVAMQQVKPEQSLTEGLGEAGGMAAIGAIGLGGATGLARTPGAPPPPPSQFNPENLSSDIVKQIESIVGIKPEQARQEMLSPEEAARQRTNLQQKQIDANEQALIEKAAREGIPPQVPEAPTPDTSKPSLAEQVPVATPQADLEAKQAQIDQLRLDAGLPTGESSKTPGVMPADVAVTDTPVPKIVDTRPLDERAANNRLLVMQNMLKNQGGDPNSLAIIPHPQVEGKFAIQSLDVPVKFTKNLPETAINRPETPKIIDPIEAYIEVARRTNTPASMRLIRDYEAGIVTKEDIQAAVDAERKANQPLPINYKGNGEPWFVAPDKYRIKGDRGERYVPLFDESKIAEEPFRPPPPKTKNELPKNLGEYKLRMPRAYDNPVYREANKQSNFQMLADAMSTSPNPIYKRIGELSQKIASKVTLHKPGGLQKRNWLGQYDPNDNSIKMRPSHAGDEWTNVHESVHALTVYAQRNPTPAQKPYVDQINNLFEHVKKELKKKGYTKKNIYGLTDPLEFTAEAMSNVEFQYMLMQIPYPGKKSTWTKFVELVADLLGITDTNALTEVMNLVDKLGQKAGGRNTTVTPMTVMGSQANQPAFKRWFGDSKVVDENGKPLVVYHGTQGDFNSFKIDGPLRNFVRVLMTKTAGVVNEEMSTRKAKEKGAAFFTSDPNLASDYAGDATGANVMPVYLSIKKPLIVDIDKGTVTKPNGKIIDASEWTSVTKSWIAFNEAALDWAKDSGADGFILKGVIDPAKADSSLGPTDVYVAFNPTQIKSAIGNTGEFNPENLNILGAEDFSVPAKPSGQSAIDIVEGMGRTLEKPTQSMLSKARESWDNALDNPKATAEAASTAVQRFNDRVQTWSFSNDAALNNKIRRTVMDTNLESKDKIGTLLNISLSQTVHADALSNLLMTEGNLKYNNDLHKWEAIKDKSNFVELSKGLDKLAQNHGLNKEKADRIAHTAFEARRLKSMVEFNEKVDREVAEMRAEAKKLRDQGSAVAANALSEKAERRSKETKFIHMTPQQIADGVSLFKLMPELDGISKVWNDMRENTVQILVDTGLWSREEAEFMLENVDYVPFFREEQIEEGKGPKEYIRGLMVQAKEKRLKGSEKPVNDVFDNMARWMQYSVNRAVRNRSALALIDTAVDAGLAKKIEKRAEGANAVRVWRDGKEEFYDMTDPMFVEAFTGLESIAIPTWKWMAKMSDMLRQSVVMYPLFSVAQLPQDSFAAMFSSGLKAQYALSIPARAVKEFLKTIAGVSKTHEELKKVGAVGVRDFTSSMARLDAEVYAGLKAPPGMIGKLKGFLNHIAMASDNAVRQATYEAAMAQGLSRAEAIEKAFEIWNVRRKGTSKSLAFAGQVIPFFNAYLAAQNVALKTISGTGVSPTERSEAIKTLLGTTASVMVLSLLYAMMNGDDEDYLNKPAVVRDRLLMIPGTGGLSIPLRADLFSIPKIVTEHMYLLLTDKGYEDGRKFRDSMAAVVKSSIFTPTVVPQAFKPLVEIGINYDFYSGRPLIGHFEKMKETSRQFTDTTSELAKLFGSTGIMSPIAIDHLIRGMFGSVGGLMVYMTNPLLHSDPNVDRPTMSAKDMMAALPGTSGFVSRDYESGLKNDFYVLRDEVAKVANTMSDLKQRSPEKISEYLSSEEIITRYGMAKGIQKITDQLGNIRKNISRVTNAPRDVMSADEKSEQIKQLRAAERDMLKAINTKQLRATAKL